MARRGAARACDSSAQMGATLTNSQALTVAFSGFGLGILVPHLWHWYMRRVEAKMYFRWRN